MWDTERGENQAGRSPAWVTQNTSRAGGESGMSSPEEEAEAEEAV